MAACNVPDDFPRELRLRAVSGAQPKMLLRESSDRYHAGLTNEELRERYEACEDLAHQLATYTKRKMTESGWSLEEVLPKVEAGVVRKIRGGLWDFSAAEVLWVMGRMRRALSVPAPDNDCSTQEANLPGRGEGDITHGK
ncbi:hypothetical protein PQQ77_02625 [Paraburkholderia strydomiana]|uniref:hypothetical protein n=1 Tax=Paraburkholderia strydomiana TaxID=1245417 RepID=UPI0038BB3200